MSHEDIQDIQDWWKRYYDPKSKVEERRFLRSIKRRIEYCERRHELLKDQLRNTQTKIYENGAESACVRGIYRLMTEEDGVKDVTTGYDPPPPATAETEPEPPPPDPEERT